MMRGREKSDPAIVAVKPANKAKEVHCGRRTPLGVRQRKIVLGLEMAMVGGETIPPRRLCVVLRHAATFGVQDPGGQRSDRCCR